MYWYNPNLNNGDAYQDDAQDGGGGYSTTVSTAGKGTCCDLGTYWCNSNPCNDGGMYQDNAQDNFVQYNCVNNWKELNVI